MKPYGVDKKDAGCCGGHDKYPPPFLRYSTQKRNKNFKNTQRGRKKKARRELNKLD